MTTETVTEFAPAYEMCTATIHCTWDSSGEAYTGPLHIGYFSGQDEFWIEQEGQRIRFSGQHMNDFIKQLKRAVRLHGESVAVDPRSLTPHP